MGPDEPPFCGWNSKIAGQRAGYGYYLILPQPPSTAPELCGSEIKTQDN